MVEMDDDDMDVSYAEREQTEAEQIRKKLKTARLSDSERMDLMGILISLQEEEKEQERREKEKALARAEQERREKEQALARAEQERREKEQAEAKYEKNVVPLSFALERGLPPLNEFAIGSVSESKSNFPSKTVEDGSFLPWDPGGFDRDVNSALWQTAREALVDEEWAQVKSGEEVMKLRWGSEKSVQDLCGLVLRDCLKLLCLNDMLRLDAEVSMLRLAPDFSVVLMHGKKEESVRYVPIGVVEVKKPRVKDECDEQYLKNGHFSGQIHAYLRMLSCLYEIDLTKQALFGIMTTYKHWRVVWYGGNVESGKCAFPSGLLTKVEGDAFKVCQEVLEELSMLKEPEAGLQIYEGVAQKSGSIGKDVESLHAVEVSAPLHGSEVYAYNHPDIWLALSTAILRMLGSMFGLTRMKPEYKKPLMKEAISRNGVRSIRIRSFCLSRVSEPLIGNDLEYMLLHRFSNATEAPAWLAVCNGKACVLKIKENGLLLEHELWRKVNKGCTTGIVSLMSDRTTLVMPWLEKVMECERDSVQEGVRDAFMRLSRAGYKYKVEANDVSWRHVGRLNGKIMLMDFGNMEKIDGTKEQAVSSAVEEMMKKLYSSH